MYDVIIFGGCVIFLATPCAIFILARLTVPRPTTDHTDHEDTTNQDEHLSVLITAQRGAPSDDATF